ncbi:alpha/beta hydrolase [Colwellia asteriadis]
MALLLLCCPFTSMALADIEADEKALPSHMVKFKADVDRRFLLAADYLHFPQKEAAQHMGGVLILHDCKESRKNYQELAQNLANSGLHVLSLDFRGYGDSTDNGFSEQELKKQAKDLVSYQSDLALLTSYWPEDVIAAYHYLRKELDKSKGIAVFASGCSSGYTLELAQKYHVKAWVLLNPEMSYSDKERYKTLLDAPSYFISSGHQLASLSVAQELFNWNGDKKSKIQIFKVDKNNSQLLKSNRRLVIDIVEWLKFNLS